MKTLKAIASLGGVLMLLIACQEVIVITIEGVSGRTPTFVLRNASTLKERETEIRDFAVYETATDGKIVGTMWSFISEDDAPKSISRITYGMAPTGFKDVVSAKPLLSGVSYDASTAMPGRIGGMRFTVK